MFYRRYVEDRDLTFTTNNFPSIIPCHINLVNIMVTLHKMEKKIHTSCIDLKKQETQIYQFEFLFYGTRVSGASNTA